MTKTEAIEKAIARYVAKGGDAAGGRRKLAEEINGPYRNTLALTLVYWNFATRSTADRMAAALAGA